jgi:hypothetical protein
MRLDIGQHHGLTPLRLQSVEGLKEGLTCDISPQAGNVRPTCVPLQAPRYRGQVAPGAAHFNGPRSSAPSSFGRSEHAFELRATRPFAVWFSTSPIPSAISASNSSSVMRLKSPGDPVSTCCVGLPYPRSRRAHAADTRAASLWPSLHIAASVFRASCVNWRAASRNSRFSWAGAMMMGDERSACGVHIQKMFSGGRPRRIWPTVS